MWRYIILAVSLVGTATTMPALLQQKVDTANQYQAPIPAVSTATSTDKQNASFNPLSGRKARIKSDRRGHFVAKAKLNGRPMEVLVDTGATLVAINASTARRIGIRLKPSDFKHEVRTANGIAKAAAATIDEIRIGRITVRNVRASVSEDKALSVILLGMSFLNELDGFAIEDGTLILEQ